MIKYNIGFNLENMNDLHRQVEQEHIDAMMSVGYNTDPEDFDPKLSNDLEIFRRKNCENCNIEMLQHEDLLFVCEKCGYSERALEEVTNYQDNSRINSSQRYVYEKCANFLNSIKEFQNTTIPDEVKKELIDQITSHDIDRSKLTKDHIIDFLKNHK